MAKVRTNAKRVARTYRNLAEATIDGAKRGTRRAALLVETRASELISGPGTAAPGTYPVPIISGQLRRMLGVRVISDRAAMVFNRAVHALPVHDGYVHHINGRTYKGRPFLTDAVEQVNPTNVVTMAIRRAVRSVAAAGAQ